MVVNAGKIPMVAQRWHNVILQPYTTPPSPLGSIPYNGTTMMAQRWLYYNRILPPHKMLVQHWHSLVLQQYTDTIPCMSKNFFLSFVT